MRPHLFRNHDRLSTSLKSRSLGNYKETRSTVMAGVMMWILAAFLLSKKAY